MIWGDLNVIYKADAYKRKLQKAYVANVIALYKPNMADGAVNGILAKLSEDYTSNTDVRSLALNELITLQTKITETIPVVTDRLTKAHLQYLTREIEEVVGEPKDMDAPYRPFNPDLSIKSGPNAPANSP